METPEEQAREEFGVALSNWKSAENKARSLQRSLELKRSSLILHSEGRTLKDREAAAEIATHNDLVGLDTARIEADGARYLLQYLIRSAGQLPD